VQFTVNAVSVLLAVLHRIFPRELLY